MEIKTRVLTNPQHLDPSRRETARKNIAAIGKMKVSPNTRVAPPDGSDELDISAYSVPTPDASGKILKSSADGKYSWETPYGIEQVPADWDQVDVTKPDYIKNKPGLYRGATVEHPGVSGFVPAALSDERELYLKGDGTWGKPDSAPGDGKLYIALGNDRPTDTGFSANSGNNVIIDIPEATEEAPGLFGADDKEKLNGIAAGAQVNVKPDWKAASGNAAEILNKPAIDSSMTTREDNGITYLGVKNPLPGTIGNPDDVLTVKNGGPAWESRAKLPDAPINNGKYVLTCIVNNGTAVYAWELTDTTTI